MAMDTIRALRENKDLVAVFRSDPLGAIAELERRTGMKFPRVNMADIEVLRTLSDDEFELLFSIAAKTEKTGHSLKI